MSSTHHKAPHSVVFYLLLVHSSWSQITQFTEHLTKLLGTTYENGTAVAQWLKSCATNQKVAGSIPDGVMEFFIYINPSDRTMALGSTQPLTEMSTGSISWG
jgi:hypothetical protein